VRVPKLWVIVLGLALLSAGCADESIVNTGDQPPAAPPGTATAPPLPPPSNAHLVNAFDYASHPESGTRYVFTTPSGRWECAIVPRVRADCQSATGSGMGITGEPDSVPDAAGEPVAPNAIVIGREGDAQFAAVEDPESTSGQNTASEPDTAKVLGFDKILAVAGFRCNVQEQHGVSCLSELTGKGFTFSDDGFLPQYTDVPADAP
jgi:hypothetical protein